MADVVDLKTRREEKAQPLVCDSPVAMLSGTALCQACRHEWEAAAPTGVTHLECPKCGRMWGAFKNVVVPEVAWTCNCGERLFWLTPAGAMCRGCGHLPKDWV